MLARMNVYPVEKRIQTNLKIYFLGKWTLLQAEKQ